MAQFEILHKRKRNAHRLDRIRLEDLQVMRPFSKDVLRARMRQHTMLGSGLPGNNVPGMISASKLIDTYASPC